MKRLGLLLSCIVVSTGCATDDGDAAAPAQSQARAHEDAPAAGELTGPTTNQAGTTSITALSAAQGGPAVSIDGGTESGSYGLVIYGAPGAPDDATASATVAPAAGSAFVFTVIGTGASYAKRKLQLERFPGANELQASSASGTVACGTLDDRPTALAVTYHAATRTFDVELDGAPTQCTNLPTLMGAPITELEMMDASNEGYGGHVEFNDLAVHGAM